MIGKCSERLDHETSKLSPGNLTGTDLGSKHRFLLQQTLHLLLYITHMFQSGMNLCSFCDGSGEFALDVLICWLTNCRIFFNSNHYLILHRFSLRLWASINTLNHFDALVVVFNASPTHMEVSVDIIALVSLMRSIRFYLSLISLFSA